MIIHKNHYSVGFFIKSWTAFLEKWICDFSIWTKGLFVVFNKIKGQQVNWMNCFGL